MQDVVDGPMGHSVGHSKIINGDTAVLLNSGGNGGDKQLVSLRLLRVAEALIVSVFAGLYLPDDLLNLCSVQGLVPKSLFNRVLDFFKVFSGSGKTGDKVSDTCHNSSRGG